MKRIAVFALSAGLFFLAGSARAQIELTCEALNCARLACVFQQNGIVVGTSDCADPLCAGACPLLETAPSADGSAATPVAGVLAIAAVVSAGISVAGAVTSVQSGPDLLRSLLPFSAVHRRRPPWGRVVSADSGLPLAKVVLSLFDESGRVKATEISRQDGAFGFFAPPGTYRLTAKKEGWEFLADVPEAALFPGETVHTGGEIVVAEESLISLVVAGRPLPGTIGAPGLSGWRKAWSRIQIWQAWLALPLLFAGGLLAGYGFWHRPSALGGVFIGVYAVLLVLEILLSRAFRRIVGRVRSATTKEGVGRALVRFSDAGGRLALTRVTFPSGSWFAMPAPGEYRVDIIHPDFQPYQRARVKVRRYVPGVAGIRAKLTPR